jgi:hypothetical protein
MSNYKIKVKIEFIESDHDKEHSPQEQTDGSFHMVIDENDALSIDQSEKAMLMTAYPSIRKAVADHLEYMSKKKRSKMPKAK